MLKTFITSAIYLLTMINRVEISNKKLTWAIDRAGYDLDIFIEKEFPKLKDWLDNTKKPTINQLKEFSKKVHVPFGYLFLKENPIEKTPIPFFRVGKSSLDKVSLNVYDTILLLKKRQEWLSEYLEESGFDKLDYVGSYSEKSDHIEIASDIRNKLKLKLDWSNELPSWEQARKNLADAIESIGIIINFNSIVENNGHRKIDVNECKGFVLSDPYAPFMFINSDDSKSAQMFTMAHELAHIWIDKSAGFDIDKMLPANDPIELFCDKIAAEFLCPTEVFNILWQKYKNINAIASEFKISPIVAARRALDLDKISRAQFFNFYNNYTSSDKKKRIHGGGGDYYNLQKSRVGLTFMSHLNRAVKQNKILYTEAYRLSGLRGDTFSTFIEKQNL